MRSVSQPGKAQQRESANACICKTLLLDSRVLCDQQLNERRQQRFTPLAHVVHELEETQVGREFLLGNAPMRAQPTPQERPEPFHGIHMDFTHAVAIVISSELAPPMIDTLMLVSPDMQASINAAPVCYTLSLRADLAY